VTTPFLISRPTPITRPRTHKIKTGPGSYEEGPYEHMVPISSSVSSPSLKVSMTIDSDHCEKRNTQFLKHTGPRKWVDANSQEPVFLWLPWEKRACGGQVSIGLHLSHNGPSRSFHDSQTGHWNEYVISWQNPHLGSLVYGVRAVAIGNSSPKPAQWSR
jgi:hypothetical protein